MTTRTTLFDNASTQVFCAPTASAEGFNPRPVPIFDLRFDRLERPANENEFDVDDYIAEQDHATRQRIAGAGPWVADNFYPGQATLATMRLRAGLSQVELGRRCGLKQPHISRYESGLHEPGIFQAQAIARALGVPLDELVQALKSGANGA